jgi:multidrug transporter EmrE-like cation transporter
MNLKNINYLTKNSDFFGVLTCSLCLVHCISTPLILLSLSSLNTKLSISYSWWSNLDYLFLIISFLMVYISSQTTRRKSMKYFFWSCWAFLFLVIINEKTGLYELSEYVTYLTAAALSLVHLYNLRFCK